jgi:hypothetical protein
MNTETILTVFGSLIAIFGLIAMYHIAFKQGIFKRNKIYLNIITPFFEKGIYPAKTDLVLYGIPKKDKEETFIVILPIYFENRSKVALKNVRIVVAHERKLDSFGAANLLPSKIQKEYGIDRQYIINDHLNTEYLLDIMRIDQRTALTHGLSFESKLLNEKCILDEELQKIIIDNSSNKIYLSEVMIVFSAENISEIKFTAKLMITDYVDELEFMNIKSRELADEFFTNTIKFPSPLNYLKKYFSQIIDKGILTSVSINLPKFESMLTNKFPLQIENFENSTLCWYEKRYKVVSPIKLKRLLKMKQNNMI